MLLNQDGCAPDGDDPHHRGSDPGCHGSLGKDRTLLKLVERTGRQSYRAAAKEIWLSKFAAGCFPMFLEGMRQGKISAAYIEALGMVGRTQALTELAQANEEMLLEWTQTQNVKEFRRSIKRWERENGFKAARKAREAGGRGRRESLRLYPEDDGYKVSGWLTGESGSVVIRALRQESRVVVEEQGLSGTTRGAGEHHTGSSVVDLWGHGERNARSLVRILRRVLKNNRRSSAGPVSFRDTTPIRRPVLWVEPERDAQRKPNVATGFG